MRTKILSGDFAAEYNRALNSLREEQDKLDKKYSEIISEIVRREEARLEDNLPSRIASFSIGDKVTTVDGMTGTVKSLNVILDPVRPPDYDYTDVGSFGPARYFPLSDLKDEYVIASPDIIYQYEVEVQATEIERDWGVEKKVLAFYPDELSIKLNSNE